MSGKGQRLAPNTPNLPNAVPTMGYNASEVCCPTRKKLKLSNIVGGNVCVLLLRFHVRWFLPLACRAPSGRRNLCRKASHHMAYTHVYRSYRGSVKRPSPSPTNGIEQESCHCSSSVDMLTMPPYRRICLLSKERPLPDSGAGIQSSVLVVPLVWDSKTLSSVSLM